MRAHCAPFVQHPLALRAVPFRRSSCHRARRCNAAETVAVPLCHRPPIHEDSVDAGELCLGCAVLLHKHGAFSNCFARLRTQSFRGTRV